MSIWRNLEESASTEMLFGRPPDHRCTFEAEQRNRPIRGTRSIGPGNYHLITIFSTIYILEQITVSCIIQLYAKSGKPKIGCTVWGFVINLQVTRVNKFETKVHLMETHSISLMLSFSSGRNKLYSHIISCLNSGFNTRSIHDTVNHLRK